MFVIIYGMRYATVMCCVVHQATLQACEWDYNVEQSNIGTQQAHKVIFLPHPVILFYLYQSVFSCKDSTSLSVRRYLLKVTKFYTGSLGGMKIQLLTEFSGITHEARL